MASENDFAPPMPYTLGYSATSKSTDSFSGHDRRDQWISRTMSTQITVYHKILHDNYKNNIILKYKQL